MDETMTDRIATVKLEIVDKAPPRGMRPKDWIGHTIRCVTYRLPEGETFDGSLAKLETVLLNAGFEKEG